MYRDSIPIPDFAGPEPTAEELEQRKRVTDRAHLLDHVDEILRPPPRIYREIEIAIEHAIRGEVAETISSLDGHRYRVSDLIARWELDDLLDLYARDPKDSSYEPAGRPWDWSPEPTTEAE